MYKILTFNHHETYLAWLAQTGHHFDVVTEYGSLSLPWLHDRVPCPPNVNLVPWGKEVQKKLREGYYDMVLCHTVKNLVWMFPYRRSQFIFLQHIPLFRYIPTLYIKSWVKRWVVSIFCKTHACKLVAVSEFKSRSWQFPDTSVIEFSVLPFPPVYPESEAKIVMVGNQVKERGSELGWPIVEPLLSEFPITIVGMNPQIPKSVRLKDYATFQEYLRQFSIYLYTVQMPYGDGLNCSLVEAMSMGMAVVTLYNPTSPIQHGETGLVAHDLAELRLHLQTLLQDKELQKKLGENAKKMVKERFSIVRFVEQWNAVFSSAAKILN